MGDLNLTARVARDDAQPALTNGGPGIMTVTFQSQISRPDPPIGFPTSSSRRQGRLVEASGVGIFLSWQVDRCSEQRWSRPGLSLLCVHI